MIPSTPKCHQISQFSLHRFSSCYIRPVGQGSLIDPPEIRKKLKWQSKHNTIKTYRYSTNSIFGIRCRIVVNQQPTLCTVSPRLKLSMNAGRAAVCHNSCSAPCFGSCIRNRHQGDEELKRNYHLEHLALFHTV
jgi:hypothetical protein